MAWSWYVFSVSPFPHPQDCHAKYRTESHGDITPRFNERFILSLSNCSTCMVLDVSPISPFHLGRAEHPPYQQKDPHHRANRRVPRRRRRARNALPARVTRESAAHQRGAGREDEVAGPEIGGLREQSSASRVDRIVSHRRPGLRRLRDARHHYREDAADHRVGDGLPRESVHRRG